MKRSGLGFLFVLIVAMGWSQQGFVSDTKHECSMHKMAEMYELSLASDKLNYYDVISYMLDLEVNDTSTFISGNAMVRTKMIVEHPDTLILELSTRLTVDSLYVNGVRHGFSHQNDLLSISLQNTYKTGDAVSANVFYHGLAGTDENRGIFNRSHNQTDFRVTYTLSEPFGAKSWFPVKQDLQDKADSVKIHLTVPKNLKAGSNGLLGKVIPLEDGKTRYEWSSRYPIAYYLISLAVADYQEYNIYAHPDEIEDSILIQNYIYNIPGLLEAYRSDIDATAEMLQLFSDLYTLYPFYKEKYGHAMAPLGGGMEHQTMSTMVNFQFFLVAHELAHQWFGNNVTCATWQDIWINEGFASYSEYIAIQKLLSQEQADAWMQNAFDRIVSRNDGSVFVPLEEADDPRRIFNYRLSYKKGAAIIHMLRFEINDDDLFFKTLQEFQDRYKDQAASGEDFKNVVEDVTGEGWDYFFDQWYYGEGYPIYTITWTQSSDSLLISSEQKSSTDYPQVFESDLEFQIFFNDNSEQLVRVRQDEAMEIFAIPVQKTVQRIEFDPNLFTLKRISGDSYFRKREVPEVVEIIPNPTDDNFRLQFSPTSVKWNVFIYSMAGRLIYNEATTSRNLEIDTSGWSEGVYIVKANGEDKSVSRKVQVSR
jgi:aminopeptidase N